MRLGRRTESGNVLAWVRGFGGWAKKAVAKNMEVGGLLQGLIGSSDPPSD